MDGRRKGRNGRDRKDEGGGQPCVKDPRGLMDRGGKKGNVRRRTK